MNFRRKIGVGLLLCTALCSAAHAQIVAVPDSNLAQAVRAALRLPPNVQLTNNHLRRLNELNADGQDIKDLIGLEYAVNLRRLHIPRNPISDLTPIANLKVLTYLDVGVGKLSDIGPIQHLTNLTTLLLSGNRITDVSPLANLVNLTHLRLNNNGIIDINPLANLTNLIHLSAKGNRIVEVTPLANLENLNFLELQNNRITDITPLANLTNLEYLNTQHNPIFDPDSPLVHISDPNLRAAIRETLRLPDDIPVTRAALRQLTRLDVANSQVTNLTGLEHATSLTFLALQNNDISDLRPFSPLVNLTFVRLHGNQINDLSPLANLTEITTLLLSANKITDISPLANLTQLTTLTLDDNNITDISPLVNLTNLEWLELQINQIADHSPVNALSLDHFVYDEACDMLPLPLEPRLENRTFPSVFSAWGGRWSSPVLNRPNLRGVEPLALHDLYFAGPMFDLRPFDTGDGWELRGVLERAEQLRDDYLALNSNMIFLVRIEMREANPRTFPNDSPYWVRDADGESVAGWGSSYLLNFTHPGVQEIIVQQAVAVSKCGLYDGVFFDWWEEEWHVLGGKYVTLEAEQRARDNILQRIRAETRPDFLIMGNTNRDKIPRTGKHINGSFMETLIPRDVTGDRLEELLTEVENSLLWLDTNLKEPRINALEGWSVPTEPPDSPTNLRWMRAFTALSLTHSNGYVLFQTGPGHDHYWYDFWDADLGRPVGPKAQLYDENIPGLYIREFTNGWAVYNHSGIQQVVTLPEEAQAVAGGWAGTEHVLPNLDGEMYLRKTVVSDQSPVTSKNPADVNGDGAVNILDLVVVAQALGTDKAEGDVNGDGVVNVFDLVFVAGEMQ